MPKAKYCRLSSIIPLSLLLPLNDTVDWIAGESEPGQGQRASQKEQRAARAGARPGWQGQVRGQCPVTVHWRSLALPPCPSAPIGSPSSARGPECACRYLSLSAQSPMRVHWSQIIHLFLDIRTRNTAIGRCLSGKILARTAAGKLRYSCYPPIHPCPRVR